MRSEQQIQADIEQCVFRVGVIVTNARVERSKVEAQLDALGEELKAAQIAAAQNSPARMAERIAALEALAKKE